MGALGIEEAPCPSCSLGPLLVNAQAVAVMPAQGNVAEWYGEPAFGHLMVGAIVECNRSACGFKQPIEAFIQEHRSG